MPHASFQSANRPSVRLLVMGWCVWLLVVWAMLWTQMSVGLAAVRWLVFAGAVGMLLIWPAVRLSQWGAVGAVLLDWAALNVIWQAVIWPLKEIARWPIEQVVWLSLAMAAWSLGTGALIGFGAGRGLKIARRHRQAPEGVDGAHPHRPSRGRRRPPHGQGFTDQIEAAQRHPARAGRP